MSTYVLVVYIVTGIIGYGRDAIPTIEFKTEQQCKIFAEKMKAAGEDAKTRYACIAK